MADFDVNEKLQRSPTHPGEILREEVFPALGLTVTEAARQLGVSRQSLHKILSGRRPVTTEMALRLGKFCGNGPRLWLRMQLEYSLWHSEREIHLDLERVPAHGTV